MSTTFADPVEVALDVLHLRAQATFQILRSPIALFVDEPDFAPQAFRDDVEVPFDLGSRFLVHPSSFRASLAPALISIVADFRTSFGPD